MVKDDFGFLGQIFENIGLQSSQYERLEYWRYVCRTSNRHIRSLTASQHAATQQLQGYLASKNPPLISQCPNHL